MRLPPSVVEVLEREAAATVPEEACGLLIGRRVGAGVRVERAVPCENTLPPDRRARRFAIDPRRVIEAERAGREIGEEVVGFYHSHPVGEPVPSSIDRGFMALWPDSVWLIIAAEAEDGSGGIRGWVAAPDPSEPPEEVRIDQRSPPSGGEPTTNQRPDRGEGNEGQ